MGCRRRRGGGSGGAAAAAFFLAAAAAAAAHAAPASDDVQGAAGAGQLRLAQSQFISYDIDGDGSIDAEEAQSLPRLVQQLALGEDGHHPTRGLADPVVCSNALFFIGGLMWWLRGCRVQSALLTFCGVASCFYHAAGEPSPSVWLLVDSTAAKLTFLHTLTLVRKMQSPAKDWPGLAFLIVAALLVYKKATPLRWQPEYTFWHTMWHVLVFAGQAFLCICIAPQNGHGQQAKEAEAEPQPAGQQSPGRPPAARLAPALASPALERYRGLRNANQLGSPADRSRAAAGAAAGGEGDHMAALARYRAHREGQAAAGSRSAGVAEDDKIAAGVLADGGTPISGREAAELKQRKRRKEQAEEEDQRRRRQEPWVRTITVAPRSQEIVRFPWVNTEPGWSTNGAPLTCKVTGDILFSVLDTDSEAVVVQPYRCANKNGLRLETPAGKRAGSFELVLDNRSSWLWAEQRVAVELLYVTESGPVRRMDN